MPSFVPVEKKSLPPKAVPSPGPHVPAEPSAPTSPPPADDDFARQYADFDEASVAEISQSVPVATATAQRRETAPKPSAVNLTAALNAAKQSVPENLRAYLADRFQVEFSRYVPAGEAQFFSIFGDVTSGSSADAESDDIPASDDDPDRE